MPNLLQSLGRDYFNQRFEGSMFIAADGRPSYVIHAPSSARDKVTVKSISGNVGRLSTSQHDMDADFFSGMEVFRVPELGWRSVQDGRYLTYMSRNNRSYSRGVAFSNLRHHPHSLSIAMQNESYISESYYTQHGVLATLVMKPEYLTLAEGLAGLREGNLLSFAMSPNMMVVAESEEAGSLYLGMSRVGSVSFDGTINCNISYVKNSLEESA